MTKIIVECNKCKHQYKIHDKRIGEKFSCFCGNLLTVPSVKIHDAAVVRCSSCGGARGKDLEPFCRYCGSSFTLHERDLNTICPHCMTRISSKAKFCHSCSTPIVSDTENFELTKMPCPSCDGMTLHSRKMQGQPFSVKECDHCAGLWLSADVFRHLEQKAQKEAASGVQARAREYKVHQSEEIINPVKFYKKCPQCQVVMHRKNYANSSGIVVDVCAKHGMWFDIHELDEILAFIRSGLLLKHQEKAARIAKREVKRNKTSPMQNTNASHNTVYDITSRGDVFSDIIGWLLD
jgi:Zn-finger nucleic acid-binding protein